MAEAVVLSGGGANGGYEVGVIKALTSGHSAGTGLRTPEITAIAATSIGAFNAAVLLSHFNGRWHEAAAALEAAWLHRISAAGATSANGVFRYRPNFTEWMNVSSLVTDPMQPARELMGDAAFLARDWMARMSALPPARTVSSIASRSSSTSAPS